MNGTDDFHEPWYNSNLIDELKNIDSGLMKESATFEGYLNFYKEYWPIVELTASRMWQKPGDRESRIMEV